MFIVGFIYLFCSIFCLHLSAQVQEWVYQYNGSGNDIDKANAIVQGLDGNIYATGFITDSVTGSPDLALISLTPSGNLRWVYTYNGSANADDAGYSITVGADSNIYVAGVRKDSLTYYDFLVISLTPEGDERWVYTYLSGVPYPEFANSIVYGSDGNLYAAGKLGDMFAVISLTTTGSQRWVYLANTYIRGEGKSIICGDNIYASGQLFVPGYDFDLAVVGLDFSGNELFVYTYPGTEWNGGCAFSIVQAPNGLLYPAGTTLPQSSSSTFEDFTVQALSGPNRIWRYEYNGNGDFFDQANSIIYASDDNLYATGYSCENSTSDITTISITPGSSPVERWVYHYNGSGNGADESSMIVQGEDENLYIAGKSYEAGTYDFAVISLSLSGTENWVYTYDGSGNSEDGATSLISVTGALYVAGYSTGISTGWDFTVIKLGTTGIKEKGSVHQENKKVKLFLENPVSRAVDIRYTLPCMLDVKLYIHNRTGRRIKVFSYGIQSQGRHRITNDLRIPSGVYFLTLEAGEQRVTKKMVFIRQ